MAVIDFVTHVQAGSREPLVPVKDLAAHALIEGLNNDVSALNTSVSGLESDMETAETDIDRINTKISSIDTFLYPMFYRVQDLVYDPADGLVSITFKDKTGETVSVPLLDMLTVVDRLTNKVDKTSVGANDGVAELDSNGKLPSAQLPAAVVLLDSGGKIPVSAMPSFEIQETDLSSKFPSNASVKVLYKNTQAEAFLQVYSLGDVGTLRAGGNVTLTTSPLTAFFRPFKGFTVPVRLINLDDDTINNDVYFQFNTNGEVKLYNESPDTDVVIDTDHYNLSGHISLYVPYFRNTSNG